MGPLLIFDKSLLHVLNPEELEELSNSFMIVGTPTLIREIIADLKKPDRDVPQEMVMALARKMYRASPTQPANFRKLAVHNLDGVRIPMRGQVPVDGDAPNVAVIDGGRGMLYDKTPEQRVWERWANGDFTVQDETAAHVWRANLERVNLRALGTEWKEYVLTNFPTSRNVPDLISEVDQLLAAPRRDAQRSLLHIIAGFLNMPLTTDLPAAIFVKHGCKLASVAPYAASILRLYLTFVGCIAKGLIGPRASHYVDLQYLFYAPFCMVFASDDNLHAKLWPAVSGVNTFLTATDLKRDLTRRIELRKNGIVTFRNGYPIPLDDSVISAAMDRAFRPGWRERIDRDKGDHDDDPMKPGTLIDDLPTEHRDRIRAAFKKFDTMPDEAKPPNSSPLQRRVQNVITVRTSD